MSCVTTMDKKQLTKLISYFAMGDGGVYRRGNQNAQFIMQMKKENIDYVNWVASVLSNLVKVRVTDSPDYNSDGFTRQPQVRLESNNHPFLTKLRERIYTIDGHKSLDMHTLKLLDWEAMAILFMSDGCTYEYLRPEIGMKTTSLNVTLNMKRLSEAEQLVLKQTIRDKLNVEFNVNKQNSYYYLRLRNRDVNKFMDGIEPFIVNSFKYKVIRMKSSEKSDGEIV